MFPHEIVFSSLTEEQKKKLVFRNVTNHRLVVKLQPMMCTAVHLSRRVIEVPPNGIVKEYFLYKPESSKAISSPSGLLVFVRSLSRENARDVARWIKETSETKNRYLAFKLDFKVTSDLFNAQKVGFQKR